MEPKKRKTIRLSEYDYNTQGYYFITICVQGKKCLLSQIVGDGVLDVPKTILSNYGKIAEQQILEINKTYTHINIGNYVIMPNHIHFIVSVNGGCDGVMLYRRRLSMGRRGRLSMGRRGRRPLRTVKYRGLFRPLKDFAIKNIILTFGKGHIMIILYEIGKIT